MSSDKDHIEVVLSKNEVSHLLKVVEWHLDFKDKVHNVELSVLGKLRACDIENEAKDSFTVTLYDRQVKFLDKLLQDYVWAVKLPDSFDLDINDLLKMKEDPNRIENGIRQKLVKDSKT